MKALLKALLKKTPLYPFHLARNARLKRVRKIQAWEAKGRPVPPINEIKQQIVAECGRRHGCRTLVETGTYKGDMICAQLRNFDRIFSIELSEQLHKNACLRFKDQPHVSLLLGDSGSVMKVIAHGLPDNTLFYLDGHWSDGVTAKGGLETPIIEELNCIFARGAKDVILIDDARCFNGTADYPKLEELKAFCISQKPGLKFEVTDDIIRITC